MLRAFLSVVLALAFGVASASCGGQVLGIEAQDRPDIVAVFPANGAVVPWISYIRVTYNEKIRVLNDTAARLNAQDVDDGGIQVTIYPDPTDDHSILIFPSVGGHFFPFAVHELEVREGAVVNMEDHYRLDEFKSEFTLGAPPNAFLSASDGQVYEVLPYTAVVANVTSPPAGYVARDPLGSSGRIWVWLDPVAPGSSLLGTFVPGDAVITPFPLVGGTGTRLGTGLALSPDERTLYATAEYSGENRLRAHRIELLGNTEIGPSLELVTPLAGTGTTFQTAVDVQRYLLYVSYSDGASAGLLAAVDLVGWTELDLGTQPGVDARPVPTGAGPCSYEPTREVLYMVLRNSTTAGMIGFDCENDLAQGAHFEGTVGVPFVGFPTPDAAWFVQGLDGYAGTEGLVRSDAGHLSDGTAVDVLDDIGGVLQGSFRVHAILGDPAGVNMLVYVDDDVRTILCVYDVLDDDFFQVDMNPLVDGVQGVDYQGVVGGVVTGATVPLGILPP